MNCDELGRLSERLSVGGRFVDGGRVAPASGEGEGERGELG